jgi:hypothetical protein
MNWKRFGSGCGLIEALWNLCGMAEKNHKKSSVWIATVQAEVQTPPE